MRIDRVYTRAGDQGNTRLVMGREVSKDDTRIEAYGTVDELNTILGLARTFHDLSGVEESGNAALGHMLRVLQSELFTVGSDLATQAEDRWEGMVLVGEAEVARLERWIDLLNERLPPLQEFVIPGGGPVNAFLHQARTVCRRAERRVVTLIRSGEEVNLGALRYLNRLSDLLFVMARYAAKLHGEPEFFWENPNTRPSES